MSLSEMYGEKEKPYFENVREEVLDLLPRNSGRVLEIGCGSGRSLEWIKKYTSCNWAAGVEINETVAQKARKVADEVYVGDAEEMDIPIADESLDALICLDSLEHLRDPWTFLRRMTAKVRVGGVVLTSIPNVRHLRVLLPLIFHGKWEYQDEGILDRTHLRFFTRQSSIALLTQAGLNVEIIRRVGSKVSLKSQIVNIISLGILGPFLVAQYVLLGRKTTP